ncbi:MAG: lytic transglycosylase domain-containing protein [Clostridia bacterium]|nr:lytic transglycosylase domain-containing protein [Clostridia bacterium]
MNKIAKKNKLLPRILLIATILIAILLLIYNILRNYVYPLKHFDIVKNEAAINNIDPYLIMAIIKSESGFNKNAVSNKQARGLMQIMESTANDIKDKLDIELETDNLYDEETNIKIGCKYMKYLIDRYDGNYYIAICAYNAGLGNIDKWLEQGIIQKDLDTNTNTQIPFKETAKYLDKVISSYKMYRLLY